MRLRGVQYRRIQTGPAFGMGFEDKPGHAYFHFLAVGTAYICTDDGELHQLSAGSAAFMPHGRRHQLLSDAGITFQDIEKFDAAPLGESVSGVDTCPSTHPMRSAVIFYGCMDSTQLMQWIGSCFQKSWWLTQAHAIGLLFLDSEA